MTGVPFRHKGNENLFLAVEMSLVSTLAGIPLHVHAEGLRGTGKTTVMRFASRYLPAITRIKGCLYQCEPDSPHCPQHSARDARGDGWEAEQVPMPFVEIGHAAKLGSVVGSIDLARLTDPSHPEASLLPGTIPQASRGIVFVDEINRLAETAPEITDVLLSVMGTKPGRLRIEETGLRPVEIEVRASVWAASNPDEDPGPLEHVRRQLADRFDLVVAVNRPTDPDVVERLLSKKGPLEGEPASVCFHNLADKARRFHSVTVSRFILRYIAELYVSRNIESLRAVESLELCSRLAAAIRGKDQVTLDELIVVAPMVLRHRVEPVVLAEILKDMEGRRQAAGSPPGQRSIPGDSAGRPDLREARAAGGAQVGGNGPSGGLPEEDGPDTDRDRRRAATGYRAATERGSPGIQRVRPGEGARGTPDRTSLFGRLGAAFRRWLEPGSQASLPSPLTTLPVSPPDPARPLSLVRWEEMVLPGAWRLFETESGGDRPT